MTELPRGLLRLRNSALLLDPASGRSCSSYDSGHTPCNSPTQLGAGSASPPHQSRGWTHFPASLSQADVSSPRQSRGLLNQQITRK